MKLKKILTTPGNYKIGFGVTTMSVPLCPHCGCDTILSVIYEDGAVTRRCQSCRKLVQLEHMGKMS